ncbi:uncharacterized protein ppp1r3aa isoform X2 [Sardina pilchardus]|uniref:uncharacterized protein ppp1r3aa isoform X2 n=1 Tax=Sardina pilchardus TaxID=27697 RepID=UPI002E14E731
MSAEEAQVTGASSFASRLDSSPWLRSAAMKDENKSRGVKGERTEMDGTEKWYATSLVAATALTGSTDASEESEPESPPANMRRRVSFADAFGLDLVSVKEFSSKDQEGKVEDYLCGLETDDHYLSCLFTPPAPDVLQEKVEGKKVALAAIELLQGTTIVRGTVRVANLCFQKAVYVRTTFDCWANHFDLLAEYIPGSSTKDTDDFTFRLTLIPPFEPEGLRVEFCLRYETPAGNFWENNDGMNFVLYCRKRDHWAIVERWKQSDKSKVETKPKGKRSCLKASGKIQPETYETEETEEIPDSVSHKAAQRATRKAVDNTDRYASEECLQKTLVDSRRSRRRARVANVKDYFAQKNTEAQLGHSLQTPEYKVETWSNETTTTELLRDEYANNGADKGQVLTYHEIPLQSLSWDRHSAREDITSIPGHRDLCNGAIVEHLSETAQNERDISTQGVHRSVSKNNTIHAVEELNSSSQPRSSSLDHSDSAVQPGISGLTQVAQTETDASVQDIFRPRASVHVTAASSSSGMEEAQESACHVIDDLKRDVQEGNPALGRAGRRSEFECVSRAASLADYELEALEMDDHKAPHRPSSPDQTPLTQGSHGLEQVTSPWERSDEAKSEATASEEVTVWDILAPAVQSANPITTEGTAQTAEHVVPQAPACVPPQESAQSSPKITAEAVASIETIRNTAAETTAMAPGQIEGEMTATALMIDANKTHAVEPATTQVSSLWKPPDMIAGVSPGPWVGEGKGRCELSANTMAKVGGGGESQDHVSPTAGDDTVTFTDADGEMVCERAHPMRSWEEGEEEEEEEEESRDGRREHPFKILNEREESGEAKRDTIGEEEGDSSQEMSRFKEAVSVVSDRLECMVSKEKRKDHDVEDWKDEMEKCLGKRREQGSISEPALYEQFAKATKGLERECQRKSDSEMLSEAFERMPEERCLKGDDSPAPANLVGSEEEEEEEEQGTTVLAQGSEELLDVSPDACIEGGSNDDMPVHSVITLLDQKLAQDPYVPIPTPIQTLCSIQSTLGGRDPFLFRSDEASPVLQVGAATWSTCAISAPLGDGHEIEVVLRHRRPAQPAEHLLQSPLEEAEIHGQFAGIVASSSSSDVDSPAPLCLWLSEFCSSQGPLSRAALYAALFAMFFLTAFVCDLPVCLAIYLFSLCWWWCQGERRPLPGSKGVDYTSSPRVSSQI